MDGWQRTQQRRGVRINFNKELGRRHDRKEQGEKGVIMVIRKTSMEDLEQVLLLCQEARQFMHDHGNPHQWGQFYPPREIVEQDIRAGKSYVCEEGGSLLGTFYFAVEADSDYGRIYEGEWQGTGAYGVMHRVAAPGRKKGTASLCIEWCLKESGGDLRIDTHRDNIPMQKLLEKNGFVQCGIIHLSNGDERIAYEKVVKNS